MEKYKNKFDIKEIVLHWFTYHRWLKLIALILAVILWIYIKDEIGMLQ